VLPVMIFLSLPVNDHVFPAPLVGSKIIFSIFISVRIYNDL